VCLVLVGIWIILTLDEVIDWSICRLILKMMLMILMMQPILVLFVYVVRDSLVLAVSVAGNVVGILGLEDSAWDKLVLLIRRVCLVAEGHGMFHLIVHCSILSEFMRF
jgi:hypothetical protein